MKIRNRVFCMVMFCTCWVIATGQDWKADLLVMNKAYLEAQSFQMDIVVKSYASKDDAMPLMTANGKVLSAYGKSYSEMMGKITLMNDRCILMVDHKQRMMLYKKKSTSMNTSMNGFSLANLDSVMMMYEHTVIGSYIANSTVEKRIGFQYKTGPIDKIEMAINPINNTLTEMIYYYNTRLPNSSSSVEKVVISFNNIQLNNSIPDSSFSEEEFILISGDGVVAVSKYSSYQVINQDQAQTQ